jgi:uncharacterized membrane protein
MNDHDLADVRNPSAPIVQVKETQLSALIAAVLRYGVLTSALLVLIGYLAMVRHGLPTRHFARFTGVPTPGRYGILDVLLHLQNRHSAQDVITLGLLVLIATPVVRVGMSWVVFLYERDKLYAVLTALVFAILMFSLLGRPF